MKLPTMKVSDIHNLRYEVIKARLEAGAHILTVDGVEMFVILNLDNYYALLPVKPTRQPKMRRIGGVLFREVI